MDKPWPSYPLGGPWPKPCCVCDSDTCPSHRSWLPADDPERRGPEDQSGRLYPTADGLYWLTAGWDSRTRRWWARCCNGHLRQGKTKFIKEMA